jgi:hypothetical protein
MIAATKTIRRLGALVTVLTATALALGAGTASASQDCFGTGNPETGGYGVSSGCFDGLASTEAGAVETRAASTPDALTTKIHFNTVTGSQANSPFNLKWPAEPAKDILTDLPPGLIGDPASAARCSLVQLGAGPISNCSPASQVGLFTLTTNFGQIIEPYPLFSLVPPPNSPAMFGLNVSGTVITFTASLRPGPDYGISVNSFYASEGVAFIGADVTFWGDPANSTHDFQRSCPGKVGAAQGGPNVTECPSEYTRPTETSFLRLPTSCTGPLQWGLHTDSYFHPAAYNPDGTPDLNDPNWKSQSYQSHETPGFPEEPANWGPPLGDTGCAEVPFEPEISVQPTTHQADSPTGLNVDLTLPQTDDPSAIGEADLNRAEVTLPAGMSVNPASANGQGACTEAQIDLKSASAPNCPDDSKIGSAELDTPLLGLFDSQGNPELDAAGNPVPDPLHGAVYLAKQNENRFHSLLAIYIVLEGHGLHIKLPGKVIADPQTGQLKTVFEDQPQAPFSRLHLSLFGGSTAPLRTPPTCGAKTTVADLRSWAEPGQPVPLTDSFQVTEGPGGSPCPNGAFAPKLNAGTLNPLAATYSSFVLKLSREDASPEIDGLTATLPPGLIGKLAGIPYCPDAALAAIPITEGTGAAQLASPSCPALSQVGAVTAGAGAGPNPFYVNTGKAYLAGPYKGAPLSLAIVTPALAGPFDLGNVVVRTALRVNPETTQITATSDPIPTILDGIPLDLRDLVVDVNRSQFTLNPTSCDPMAVDAVVGGTGNVSANVSDRFQVGNCAALAFKPKLALSLKGGTRRSQHPALRAVLTYPRQGSYANIAAAQVTLPHSEFLDNAHIKTICTRVQFAAHACPAASVYGHATAVTPLLGQPLSGPVYLRSSTNKLPDLVADLNGQIEVALDGRIDTGKGGGIRNTFEVVPDAPVTKFTLTMQGAKKGLLENSENLCRKPQHAVANFTGQNGKIYDTTPVIANSCKEAGKRKGSPKKHR